MCWGRSSCFLVVGQDYLLVLVSTHNRNRNRNCVCLERKSKMIYPKICPETWWVCGKNLETWSNCVCMCVSRIQKFDGFVHVCLCVYEFRQKGFKFVFLQENQFFLFYNSSRCFTFTNLRIIDFQCVCMSDVCVFGKRSS